MVDRCLTPVVAVDLDGTLLATNTFRDFLLFAARRLPLMAPALAALVAMRKVRIISHSTLKYITLKLVERRLSVEAIEHFVDDEIVWLNSSVHAICEAATASGHLLLLATAAPQLYAERIGERLGFASTVATPPVSTKAWRECKGLVKSEAALRWAEANGGRIVTVVTDHNDDIPLMSIPGVAVYKL